MDSLRTSVIVALAVGLAGVAMGDQPGGNAQDTKSADRVVYDRLTREIRRANQDLSKLYDKALEQARADQGQVPNDLQARILSLKEQIDRKTVRLTLLATRHGWEVPRTNVTWNGKTTTERVNEDLRLLLPKDQVISDALFSQARVLAVRVYLPITPVVRSTGAK